MTEEMYLNKHNASRQDFGDSALHKNKGNNSDKTWGKIVDAQAKKDKVLYDRREELRQEYAEKVKNGEIKAPSRNEKLIATANGHPDLEATQAARRLLEKRGISWGDEDNLSDTFYEPIPLNFALKLAPVIDRAPQTEFNRLAQNPAVASAAIQQMREHSFNLDGLVKDSATLTDEGIKRLKEGLWQTLFPNTKTTDFPDYVSDKILKNLGAFLTLKNNPKVFVQFQTALSLGEDWKKDGRPFEEYVQAVQFDDPLDAEEFYFLCPYLYDIKNDKFAWLLNRYIQNGGGDRALFLRSLGADSGVRIAKQQSTGLSDSYIWRG